MSCIYFHVTIFLMFAASRILYPSMFSSIPVTKSTRSVRYNVRINESDNSAIYEIALPGYTKSEVEVRYSSNRLTVSSSSYEETPADYVVQTFDKRPFSLSWSVSGSKVASATMKDGVLRVVMSQSTDDPSDLVPVT